ncbi:MAG: hypothetical protein LBS21_07750 [Clostridiales bacterium]|jgi:hypothetical protein|nr:hypothetical protein [Clostridiales bacterium]
MEIFKDKRMAWAIAAMIIFAVIFIDTERELNAIKRPVAQLLETGSVSVGDSLQRCLQVRLDNAANLIAIAERYESISGNNAILILRSARDELINVTHLPEKCTANRKLSEAAQLLYYILTDESLSEEDYALAENEYSNIKNSDYNIAFEAANYNDRAREFNRLTGVFPGVVVKALGMTSELELFEEAAN